MLGPSLGKKVRFSPGTKFACIALHGCTGLRLPATSTPRANIVVLSDFPFEIPRDWKETLGSYKVERLAASNLLIVASVPSARPYDRDDERECLIRTVRAFCFGLWMLGGPNFDSGLLLAGGTADSDPQILMVQDLIPVFLRPRGAAVVTDCDTLRYASRVGAGLTLIHKNRVFDRLERGFWTWVGGIREGHLHIRLHQFVRAVDALIASERGQGRRQFVERAQTFATTNQIAAVLGQLYDLRSSEEHFRPFQSVLNVEDQAEAERIGAVRVDQAERLAGGVYSRILVNPALWDHFGDEGPIRAFWAKSEQERRRIWGDPVKI